MRSRASGWILATLWLGICAVAFGTVPTNTTVSATPSPATFGHPVTLIASVGPAPGTGKVTFYDGVGVLGTSQIFGGQAVLTTSLLPAGVHSVHALYAGNGTFSASSSAAVLITVNALQANAFQASGVVASSLLPTGMVVADFNGDGVADIAGSGSIVMIGNGDGTFKTPVQVGLGLNFYAAADMNGDGKTDLIAGSDFKNGINFFGTISVVAGNGDGTFQTPVTYQLGQNNIPRAIVVGDFNGDGKPDIAVACADPGGDSGTGVFILLGNGDGTLQTPVALASTTGTPDYERLALGDFNGDGKTDLVTSDSINGVRVFPGNGDGTFGVPTAADFGFSGGPVVVTDFNGDGKSDIAVGGGTIVDVLLGNGDGSFTKAGSFPVGPNLVSLAWGDFNGDGNIDLVVAGNSALPTNTLSILYGDGTGAFQVVSNLVASSVDFAVVGDFNGDGRSDLAVLSGQFNVVANGYSILLGRVTTASTTSLVSSLNPATYGQNVSLTVTISPSSASGTVTIYDGTTVLTTLTLSGGQAVFNTSQLSVGNHSLTAIYGGDANYGISTSSTIVETVNKIVTTTSLTSSPNPSTFGQSVLLTATVPNTTGQVNFMDGQTFLGTGSLNGGVATFVALSLGTGSHALTASFVGDANDTASTSPVVTQVVKQGFPTQTLLISTGNPVSYGQNLTLSATVSPLSASGTVVLYDGAAVIGTRPLVGGRATFTTSLLNTGTHSLKARYGGDPTYSFSFSTSVSQTIISVPASGLQPATSYGVSGDQVLAGDFNGDGKTDLLVSDHNGHVVNILLGNGNGTFQTPKSMGIGGQPNSPAFLTTGDINGDGITDLVVSYYGQVGVWLGNGDGTFQPAVYTTVLSTCAAVGDFNGDGKPDVALCSGGQLGVAFGGGDGTFQGATNYPAAATDPTAISLADLNGDGNADVVVVSYMRLTATVFLGNGDGTFKPGLAYPATGSNPTSVAIGDLNGDGKPDLAVTDISGSVNVLLGNGDGSFQKYVSYPGGAGSASPSIAIGDINGDGKADVVVAGSGINILLGNGDGSLQGPVTSIAATSFSSVALGDFNGDGRVDIAASGGNLNVLLGNGLAQLKFTTQPVASGSTVPTVVVQVLDASGNVIMSNFAVTLTSTPAGINTTATATNGTATFSNLVFASPGTYTLTASSPGIPSATSNSFTIVPATPPAVVIDTPAAGAVATLGSLMISGWAIDALSGPGTAISSVKVMVDGTFVANASYGTSRPDVCAAYPGRPGCPNVGYSYLLNTSGLSAGTHTLTVVATDSDTVPDSASSSVTFSVSNVPPSVHIDGPISGSVVSGAVTVSGWAIDNTTLVGTAISTVQIKVDGSVAGNATYGVARPDVCSAFPGRMGCPNVGFTFALNAGAMSAGSHVITATAMDSDGNPDSGSTSVTITVTSTPPTVFIDNPAPGAVLGGTATVSGWAIDNGTAIAGVVIKVDGNVVGNATYGSSRPDVCAAFPGRPGCPNVGFTFALDVTRLAPGAHMLTAVATDSDGTPDSASWTVAIQVSVPPTVFIDTPAANTVISGTTTVSGWAVDSVTAIGSVQIKVDGVAIGSATYGSPRPDVCAVFTGRPGCPNVGFTFQLNTSGLSLGAHTITAVASDTDGNPDMGTYTVTITVGASLPKVFVDSLASGATVSGTVTLSGWAFGSATLISGVLVKVDGSAVGSATYGSPRPDVCAAFQGPPGCPNVGFTFPLNSSSWSSGSHTVTVVASDMNGNSGSYSLMVLH